MWKWKPCRCSCSSQTPCKFLGVVVREENNLSSDIKKKLKIGGLIGFAHFRSISEI